ncbi:glycosyltransferase family 2 protein [Arthrobacter sp. Sr33]
MKWTSDKGLRELTEYLTELAHWIDVLVIDGSPEPRFTEHARTFPPTIKHTKPLPLCRNGKAAGVMTGIALTDAPILVIADDDVRYDARTLHQAVAFLSDADMVRPQNIFTTSPWHAQWDTARTLINRAFGADFPGTLVIRREALLRTSGYDGNVLFENLELLRTIGAAGGIEVRANHLFVGRLPPTLKQFLHQRTRQAYDDFAQPGRLIAELSILPLALTIPRMAHRKAPVYGVLLAITWLIAEIGRRRQDGTQSFHRFAALWAPLWVAERSICIWVALILRLTGGIPYAGTRLRHAATSPSTLRKRHGGKLHPELNEPILEPGPPHPRDINFVKGACT